MRPQAVHSTLVFALLCLLAAAPPARSATVLQQIAEFAVPEANQGVAVDDRYFYAVGDRAIGKYDKKTGAPAGKWQGPKDGAIVHLDSGFVMDGKIYCAHSNYPEWPMTSSLEMWDAATLQHTGNHSFGINWGSLTWADFHNGHWWMTFANYDVPYGPNRTPYGRMLSVCPTPDAQRSSNTCYRVKGFGVG